MPVTPNRAALAPVYGRPMSPMPEPGDLIAAFAPEAGHCFRMIYDHKLQADHCRGEPAWKGIWRDRNGSNWYVEACRQHAPKVTSTPPADGFLMPIP